MTRYLARLASYKKSWRLTFETEKVGTREQIFGHQLTDLYLGMGGLQMRITNRLSKCFGNWEMKGCRILLAKNDWNLKSKHAGLSRSSKGPNSSDYGEPCLSLTFILIKYRANTKFKKWPQNYRNLKMKRLTKRYMRTHRLGNISWPILSWYVRSVIESYIIICVPVAHVTMPT